MVLNGQVHPGSTQLLFSVFISISFLVILNAPFATELNSL